VNRQDDVVVKLLLNKSKTLRMKGWWEGIVGRRKKTKDKREK
jgi:hypothetical protein